MSRVPGLRSERGCSVLAIVGWAVAVIFGLLLIYFGFVRPALERREAAQETPTPPASVTAAALVSTAQVTAWPSPVPPTATLPPTPTPQPTAPPPTATPAAASVVAGADGVNVRNGPGTSFTKLGYIDPGGSAQVTGRFGDWWQISYNGAPAWVYSEMVTASNAEGVPEVQPPPSPTPLPPAATPLPTNTPAATIAAALPTATVQAGSAQGLKVNEFTVERAPGPFKKANVKDGCGEGDDDVWFKFNLTATGGSEVAFSILGAYVQESGYHKDSYTNSDFNPGETFQWRDCLHIPNAGSYNLWLRICYSNGSCENLAGPVAVTIKD